MPPPAMITDVPSSSSSLPRFFVGWFLVAGAMILLGAVLCDGMQLSSANVAFSLVCYNQLPGIAFCYNQLPVLHLLLF